MSVDYLLVKLCLIKASFIICVFIGSRLADEYSEDLTELNESACIRNTSLHSLLCCPKWPKNAVLKNNE